MQTKWVCWNAETGFYVLDARDRDDAALECEMDQPIGMEAVLLGKEEKIKEDMWTLLSEKAIIVDTKLLDRQIRYAEKRKEHYEHPENIGDAESYGYWGGRLDTLSEIKKLR